MPDRSRCPQCGERVSPYAAGCAVCGADLDTARWNSGPSVGNRIGSSLSALSFAGLGGGWARWLLAGFLLVFVGLPILALLGL
jgi:hypothetical protein